MKKYWIFLLFIVGCSSSKKVISEPVLLKVESEHLGFIRLTNKADLAVINGDFSLAVSFYKEAFGKMEVDYAAPYYNAYLAAKEIGDCEMSYYAAKQLLQFGAWIQHFQKNPCLVDDYYLWTELEDTYMTSMSDSALFITNQSIDRALFALYDNRIANLYEMIINKEIIVKDSIFLRKLKKNTPRKINQEQKLRKLDSLSTVFIDMVERIGFPAERRVGAEWSMAGMSFQRYRHFAPAYQRNQKVKEIFDQAFKVGLVSVGEYAQLENDDRYVINPIFVKGKEQNVCIYDFNDDKIKEINLARRKIALPTYDTQIKALKIYENQINGPYSFGWLGDMRLHEAKYSNRKYKLFK